MYVSWILFVATFSNTKFIDEIYALSYVKVSHKSNNEIFSEYWEKCLQCKSNVNNNTDPNP